MSSKRILVKSVFLLPGLLLLSLTLPSYCQQEKSNPRRATPASSAPSGKQVFAANCSGCHGLDGMGTQRAPNIVTSPQATKLSATEITGIISGGVPETGMPAFQQLGKPAIDSVVAYVRGLQGKQSSRRLPGNPRNGETLFFGTAQCSTCHMATGRGGFIGPDLTTFSQTHSAEQVKAAITNPAERESRTIMITVITSNGQRYEGVLRNEDNFSLQLQSADGNFHFLSKADLRAITRNQGSIMPSDYESKVTEAGLNDIVSYLLSLANSSAPSHAGGENNE